MYFSCGPKISKTKLNFLYSLSCSIFANLFWIMAQALKLLKPQGLEVTIHPFMQTVVCLQIKYYVAYKL